jgi:hypothetical protein
MTPKVGKKFTREVEIAYNCLQNLNSKWSICKNKSCKLCTADMTKLQKEAIRSSSSVLIFHIVLHKGKDSNDIDTDHVYASLGLEWDALHDSIPRMKYTRIVTAGKQENGKYLFMCSCGLDFRYQGTCKHISVLILHASDGECAGCEIENIAVRNTAAFAACRDAALIRRAAFDWKGITCGHVTEDSLNVCPCPCEQDDESDDDGRDDRGDEGETNSSRTGSRKTSADIQLKEKREARRKELQDHFFRVKAKLDSCKTAAFWEKADGVDGHTPISQTPHACSCANAAGYNAQYPHVSGSVSAGKT